MKIKSLAVCKTCNTPKEINSFYLDLRYRSQSYRPECKECQNKRRNINRALKRINK